MNELLSLHLAKEGNVEEIVDYYGAKLESGNADICMEYMAGEKKIQVVQFDFSRVPRLGLQKPLIRFIT